MTQEQALEILKLGYNVYITGAAGSGKTYVLDQYIHYLKEQGIVVGITASTGVAATHINGITLHSWAGVGLRQSLSENDLQDLLRRRYLRKRFLSTHVLIIDEVSLLSDYTLDMVNTLAKSFRQNDAPFGGMQVVLCGDFFQLPPVQKQHFTSETHFIYKSAAWQELALQICYLEKGYRQEDEHFLRILQHIRTNTVCKEDIASLTHNLYKPLSNISTRLYTHTVDVDTINTRELARLADPAKSYTMKGEGHEVLVSVLTKTCLASPFLVLKRGALVMFVKNNFEKGYVNGTLGTVVDFDQKGFPLVETATGEMIAVRPAEWSIEEEGVIKARVRQLPLRLAWAITVHKSQGMSLDAAEIDLGKPFVPGMGYVALSRVRSLDGIRLVGLNHKALQVNEEALVFDAQLKAQSVMGAKALEEMEWIDQEVDQRLFLRELTQPVLPHYMYTTYSNHYQYKRQGRI